MQVPTFTPEEKERRLIDDGWAPYDAHRKASWMSDRQFASTFDNNYRKANPLDAAGRGFNRFDQSFERTVAPVYQDHVQPFVNRMLGRAGSALNSGYVPATGIGAVGGAGLGLLLNFVRNRASGTEGGYGMAAGLGGVTGGALGATSHATRTGQLQKEASWGDQGTDPYTAVMTDYALSNSEKQSILQAMGRLSNPEMQDLKRLIATAGGMGVGALIMRFLTGKGLISTAIGAILGGVLGHSMVGSGRLNSLNQYY